MTRTRSSAAARRTARFAVEQLEDRAVPSTVDLSVTKVNDSAGASGTVNAGAPVQYTIVVSNAGPGTATDATVADTMPAALTGVTWASATTTGVTGSAGTGTGSLNETLTLPSGSSITYTVTGTLPPTATGTISNTATATPSAADTDTNAANNSATVSNQVVPTVDLGVTKTENPSTAAPGQQVTYTVVVSNLGQTPVTGATLADTLPAALTGVTFTSTAAGGATGNTASGSGNLNETLTLPTGSSVTYTVTGTVAAGTAAGTSIANTATVSPPAGVTDNLPSNDTATATVTVAGGASADLGVTKTDNPASVFVGDTITYTIVVSNLGTTAVTGAHVVDTLPTGLTNVTWTSATGGATGSAGSGFGSINETLDLLVGGSITYTVKATVTTAARGGLTNTATVTLPAGTTDTNPANNTASASTAVLPKPVPPAGERFLVGGANGLVSLFAHGVLLASGNPLAVFGYSGPIRVATGDLTGDGVQDFVFAATRGPLAGLVEVMDGATLQPIQLFFPAPGFGTGMNVAIGDVNGDGFNDLVMATASGASLVQAYDVVTGHLLSSFFVAPWYTGGLTLAVGNVDGTGPDEIVVGAASGPPAVVVLNEAGTWLDLFNAYTNGYAGGVNVAAGDLLGVGKDQILVGPADRGTNGLVELFTFGNHAPLAAAAIALPGGDRGVRVAIRDVNGDGNPDVLYATPHGPNSRLMSFSMHPPAMLLNFDAMPGTTDGIFVG